MLEEHFTVYEESWSPPDKPLQAFVDEGYQYIFLRASNYDRYRRLPEAFADQLNFYHDLFARGCLLRVFEPASPRFDQAVTVYQLPGASQGSCNATGS